MESVKIIAPDGYEIDEEKSSFQEIVFKEKKSPLPKSWEELKRIKGYYVNALSELEIVDGDACDGNKNVFPSKEEAEAMLAMAQLCQLRDAWNQNWRADWEDIGQEKFVIIYSKGVHVISCKSTSSPMNFPTRALAEEFIEVFKDLLEIATPFL